MRVDVITLFPEAFTAMELSIIGRARQAGILDLRLHNLREFTEDRHRTVDDRPYGGGVGMVMMVEPVARALKTIKDDNRRGRSILLTPSGQLFNQQIAFNLSREEGLILVCGHYEGLDERISRLCDHSLSIGDYVLTGGEVAAMAVIEAVTRLLPGVLPAEAPQNESFNDSLLECPQYTRPENWRGEKVPEVLLSGNHRKIAEWRRQAAEKKTRQLRPDLWQKHLDQKQGQS